MLKSKNKIYGVNRRYYFTVLTVVMMIFSNLNLQSISNLVGIVGRFYESIFYWHCCLSAYVVCLSGLVSINLPTCFFYNVGRLYESNAPESELSFLFQIRDFVGIVGRFGESISSDYVSLKMLSGGVV